MEKFNKKQIKEICEAFKNAEKYGRKEGNTCGDSFFYVRGYIKSLLYHGNNHISKEEIEKLIKL